MNTIKEYIPKLDNLEHMDKFLEAYSIYRRNYEKLENLSKLVTSKEIKTVLKYLL